MCAEGRLRAITKLAPIAIGGVLSGLGAGPALPSEAPPLTEALGAVRAESGFVAPAWPDMQRARAAFRGLLDRPDAPTPTALTALGFDRRPVSLATGTATAVSDPPDAVRGRGFYLIPPTGGGAAPVLLQAPHRFKDLDTGELVAQLAVTGGFRAAAWNTVPRWAPDDRQDRRSDVAHIDLSYFNAFTRAFAEAHPEGVVVQLHGFARSNRDTAAGRAADVIVSNGTRDLRGPARRIRDCLADTLSGRVFGYGEQVFELGATTNRNAAMLRSIGFARFVHIEMDRALRRDLLADARRRAALRRCLLESAR